MPLHRVPLDRAITTIYKLLKVTMSICSFLAAILNAVLLSAAVTYVRQITVSYPSTDFSVQCSPGRVWDCSHSEKPLSFCNRKSGTGLQI